MVMAWSYFSLVWIWGRGSLSWVEKCFGVHNVCSGRNTYLVISTRLSPICPSSCVVACLYHLNYFHISSYLVSWQGMIFLTISASVTALRPQQCASQDLTCPHPSLGQSAFLFFSLYVVDLGAGAFQSVVTSFGADQFDEEDPKEKSHKTSFFNWFYQAINIGGLLAGTFLVYIQDKVNWGLGFGVALIAIVIGTFCFVAGTPYYRHHPPGGNPLARIGQVVVAAARKWYIQMPLSGDSLYEVPQEMESNIKGSRKIRHTNEFRYEPMLD